jgi:hypothetical protein
METTVSSTTRRGFLKTLAVGAGGCALSSLLIHPEELWAQSLQENLGKMPMEARWQLASGSAVSGFVSSNKAILDKVGREKFNESMRSIALVYTARTKPFMDRLGLTGNDPKAAAWIVPVIAISVWGPSEKFEIVESTPQKAVVNCVECAFWNGVQARKITDDICSMWSASFYEAYVKAMNPKLTAKLVKARPFGDSVCQWVIELQA